ncbi:MAG: hypothetical protein F6K22_18340 [Okeania sp. SIO2F4]|uniref:hypothetical protein n=1 Tax=Okeania sp. SIO2F4 TaxID=2607790 RepID=UPI00142C40D1|nr:hypothetical protein [Okeania sp. SIO2F4]NES04615.1 hypothetical protein [Okeania sp. SIO2F4]
MSAKQGQITEIESSGTFLFLRKENDKDNTYTMIYFMGSEFIPSSEISIPPDVAIKKMPAPKRASYDGHLRFKVPVEYLACDKYRVLDDIQMGDYGELNYSFSPQAAPGTGSSSIKWLQTSFHDFIKSGNALTKEKVSSSAGAK